MRGKINEQYTHANGKERTKKIHAFQVFQMGSLQGVKVCFPGKRVDADLLAGNTAFGLQDTVMTDCLAT